MKTYRHDGCITVRTFSWGKTFLESWGISFGYLHHSYGRIAKRRIWILFWRPQWYLLNIPIPFTNACPSTGLSSCSFPLRKWK